MSLSETSADFGSTPSTSIGYLTAGHWAYGTIESARDVDSYRVYMEAGELYSFFANPSSSPSGTSGRSTSLTLHGADGSLLQESSPRSTLHELVYRPETSGFYDIRVNPGDHLGSYSVHYYSREADDDFDAGFWWVPGLDARSARAGSLEYAGDSDGFRLQLTAGTRYLYEIKSQVTDLLFRWVGVYGEEVISAGQVVPDSTFGTFTAGDQPSVMLLLSSESMLGTGDYSVYARPTYTTNGNLVIGGLTDDTLIGTAALDELDGRWGADSLAAGAGNDYLLGGLGDFDDTLNGGVGADTMAGGYGDDTYIVDNVRDRVYESGQPMSGGDRGGSDLVRSSVSFTLTNYLENLILVGSNDSSGTGNWEANTIDGNSGDNLMVAWGGADTLSGGGGSDTLVGGFGADLLTGGGGADVFRLGFASESGPARQARDTITDFAGSSRSAPSDRIDLSRIDADIQTSSVNEAFVFIGRTAFSSSDATGQVRYVYDRATGIGLLLASTDLDADAELVIQLQGVRALAAEDLVL